MEPEGSKGLEQMGVLIDPLEVFDDIFDLLITHMLIGHTEVEGVDHRFDIWIVVKLGWIFDKLGHPFFTIFMSLEHSHQVWTGAHFSDDVTSVTSALRKSLLTSFGGFAHRSGQFFDQ